MSKYTRKAIIDTFLEILQNKSLDKITVKEIIETAGINRNTFYYYFDDIFDLLHNIFKEEADKFRAEAEQGGSFYEEYVRLALFFNAHRMAIKHLYDSKSRNVLNKYIRSVTGHFVNRFVRQAAEGAPLSEKGEDFITDFYTNAITGVTMHWIEMDMPEFDDRIIRIISKSFEATVDDMIASYIRENPNEDKID